MNLLTLFVGALAITSALGQCSAPWRLKFDFLAAATAGTPVDVSELDYCTTLKAYTTLDENVCCTSASINKIQEQIDDLKTTLVTEVTARDNAILDARARVVRANATLTGLIAAIEAAGETLAASDNVNAADIIAFTADLESWYDTILVKYDTFRAGFVSYQKARQTCLDALLQTQAAIYCSACDENIDPAFDATNGVSFDAAFISDVKAECATYLTASVSQSKVIQLDAYSGAYATFAAALLQIVADNDEGYANFVEAKTEVEEPETAAAQAPADADWAVATAFDVFGKLKTDVAALGGDAFTDYRRVLSGQGRTLAIDYSPLTEAGIEAPEFPENPSGRDNAIDANAFRVGVFSCIVVAFVALLF